ncbi:hypothetical protein, partial [Citrobacter youngae]|uniref:hypothetical protein n=1 Tax=Citrobacter youngae TaxID=133448 RepID=UPI0019541F49
YCGLPSHLLELVHEHALENGVHHVFNFVLVFLEFLPLLEEEFEPFVGPLANHLVPFGSMDPG